VVPQDKITKRAIVAGIWQQGGIPMLTIRLPTAEWAKAWRAMIEVAPVRLIGDDPVYEVIPIHLELLTASGFTYEIVPVKPRHLEKQRALKR
jgi:hypothetical protein